MWHHTAQCPLVIAPYAGSTRACRAINIMEICYSSRAAETKSRRDDGIKRQDVPILPFQIKEYFSWQIQNVYLPKLDLNFHQLMSTLNVFQTLMYGEIAVE
jgi:hypothetical protein